MSKESIIKEIENTADSQIKKDVKYTDEHDKEHKTTITMRRLGGRDRVRLQHYMNSGDNMVQYADLIEGLLEKALVFPHLSFKTVNEDIEKTDMVEQNLEYEDYDGKKHKFVFHFTNVRDMLNLIRSARGANESNELEQFFDFATEIKAIKSTSGKTLSLDDFDDAKHINEVANSIAEAISKALSVNGFLNIALELQRFFLRS